MPRRLASDAAKVDASGELSWQQAFTARGWKHPVRDPVWREAYWRRQRDCPPGRWWNVLGQAGVVSVMPEDSLQLHLQQECAGRMVLLAAGQHGVGVGYSSLTVTESLQLIGMPRSEGNVSEMHLAELVVCSGSRIANIHFCGTQLHCAKGVLVEDCTFSQDASVLLKGAGRGSTVRCCTFVGTGNATTATSDGIVVTATSAPEDEQAETDY